MTGWVAERAGSCLGLRPPAQEFPWDWNGGRPCAGRGGEARVLLGPVCSGLSSLGRCLELPEWLRQEEQEGTVVKGSSDPRGPSACCTSSGGGAAPGGIRASSWVVEAPVDPPSHQQGTPALGRGQVREVLAFQQRQRPKVLGLQPHWCSASSPRMLAWPRESLWTQVPEHQVQLGPGQRGPTGRPCSSPAAREGGQVGSPHGGCSYSGRSEAGQVLWPRGTWKASWRKREMSGS